MGRCARNGSQQVEHRLRGERLREAIGALKPLVPVSGRPLIERVLSSIAETAPSQVAVIVNDDSRRVREVVDQRCWPFDLEWIVETTPAGTIVRR